MPVLSYEKRLENCEYARLKAATSAINKAELEGIDKLRVVGVKKEKMAELLRDTVEKIADKHEEKAIPEEALNLYNDFYSEKETALDVAPEKPTRSSSSGSKKKDRKPVEKDAYGTRPNTLARAFIDNVKAKPMTMADVRKQEWNPKGYHFNETVKRLITENLCEMGEDKIIKILPAPEKEAAAEEK